MEIHFPPESKQVCKMSSLAMIFMKCSITHQSCDMRKKGFFANQDQVFTYLKSVD